MLSVLSSTFGPHTFVPHANPERSLSCVKCGRPKDHPIHREAA